VNRLSSLLALLLVAACSSNGGGGTFTDTDASTAGGDVTASSDTGSRPDAATPDRPATTDTGGGTTDRPATTDTGGGMPFGACGMATVNALCACGMDANCQGRALMSNNACVTCYVNAINGCCPMQSMDVATCARTMGCSDDACAARMCPREYSALQTCFGMAQQSVPACQRLMAACFGSFPFMCGG
jgi:hypothetical protein